jgi:hypothetical protein
LTNVDIISKFQSLGDIDVEHLDKWYVIFSVRNLNTVHDVYPCINGVGVCPPVLVPTRENVGRGAPEQGSGYAESPQSGPHSFTTSGKSLLMLVALQRLKSSSKMSQLTPSLRTGIYKEIEPSNFEGTFKGKVVLVTGSGRGIGKEIALSFAKSGAAVAITGRTKSEVEESSQDVRAKVPGVKVIGVVADGCKRSDLERLVKEVTFALRNKRCPLANTRMSRSQNLSEK